MEKNEVEHIWQKLWLSRKPNKGEHIRFELGGEGFGNIEQPIPRFLQAFNRASTVADSVFKGNLIGIVAWHPQSVIQSTGTPKAKTAFKVLAKTGFNAEQISKWRADVYPEQDEEQVQFKVRSYDLTDCKSNRNCLIWHSIAAEMPIYPAVSVCTWLLDPKSEVMMHIYDDRGMDVIAGDTNVLKSIYCNFGPWLLDYDRERMSKLF